MNKYEFIAVLHTNNLLSISGRIVGTVISQKHKNAPISNNDGFCFIPYKTIKRCLIDTPFYVSRGGTNIISEVAISKISDLLRD